MSVPVKKEIRAILVADMAGFSQIDADAQLPQFVEFVLEPIALVFRAATSCEHVNTWGDGIFALFNDTLECCQCALSLRDLFRRDWRHHGLPERLGIRIALHQGQIFTFADPLRDIPGALGRAIVLASRLEPIVKPGQVWITDQVAAAVKDEKYAGLVYDSLGTVALAKGFGERPVYGLRRREEPELRMDRPDKAVDTLQDAEYERHAQPIERLFGELLSEVRETTTREHVEILYAHVHAIMNERG